MLKGKSKIITIVLLIMTVVLMLAIFSIGFMLTNTSEKTSTVVPQKIKAQNIDYTKTIALNNPTNTPTSTPTPTPIKSAQALTPIPTEKLSPSPTEIVLKIASSSPTLSASASAALTKAKSLPKTGFITNAIVMFVVAGSIIFLSFLF